MKSPLVSIIIPTKNSAATLEACLTSIIKQTHKNIELIVVDNDSTDNTKHIARDFTKHVFNKGPERSTQRNYGVNKSKGEYVAIIDSDMELSPKVIESCVNAVEQMKAEAIIIPEESFGEGFWAQCKKLERSFYLGVPWMEAARFFNTNIFKMAGGYDKNMISGEDWDLSQRVETIGKIVRIKEFIFHNEGHLKLTTTIKKKFYYAKQFAKYKSKTKSENLSSRTGLIDRYRLFFKQPLKLFRNPFLGIGMLFMKSIEFFVGGLGLMSARNRGDS